jgi:GxxExxY protein
VVKGFLKGGGAMKERIIYKNECFVIQGAVYEVYREMGHGFLESVYQECLQKEFTAKRVPFVAQPSLSLLYKGQPLGQIFKPDFICFDKIVIELKAVKEIIAEHKAQVLNYLKATGMRVGLLVNFGAHPRATVIRLVL